MHVSTKLVTKATFQTPSHPSNSVDLMDANMDITETAVPILRSLHRSLRSLVYPIGPLQSTTLPDGPNCRATPIGAKMTVAVNVSR